MITYRLGPRSVLEQGTMFRVSDGPYWVTQHGKEIPMREKGVMAFRDVLEEGGCTYIVADTERGSTVRLHVAGERPAMPGMVARPYRIVCRVGVRRGRTASARRRTRSARM